jgi:carboxylesterase type B
MMDEGNSMTRVGSRQKAEEDAHVEKIRIERCTPPGSRVPPIATRVGPKYDRGRRATMRFDTISAVVEDPRSMERELWTGVQ